MRAGHLGLTQFLKLFDILLFDIELIYLGWMEIKPRYTPCNKILLPFTPNKLIEY